MKVTNIEQACKLVLAECKNEYAKAYAAHMEEAALEGMYYYDDPDKGRKTQALYILSNITHWRGETAKAVRAFLKEYTHG